LLAESDVTVSVAATAPHSTGWKTTLMVQLPPGAIEGLVPLDEVLQVSVSEKKWLFDTMVVMVSAALPVLVTVMVCGALGPPPVALVISTSPKFSSAGDKLKIPTPPWPAACALTPPSRLRMAHTITATLASGAASFLFSTGLLSIPSNLDQ
jgi:hypothetical protein